jgi:hypothetical protein
VSSPSPLAGTLQDLDTSTPRLEIGPLRFIGQYAYVIGTVVVVSPPGSGRSGDGEEGGAGAGAGAGAARIESLVRKKIVFKLAAGSLAASRAAAILAASQGQVVGGAVPAGGHK